MAAIFLIAAQAFYVATAATFGCTSVEDVERLSRLRASKQSFEHALYDEVFLGQCVMIAKGSIVEASKRDTNTLLVDRRIIPPGYIALSGDFKPITADEQR